MARFIDAAVDTTAEMLDEGTEQAMVGFADGKSPIQENARFPHFAFSPGLECRLLG
jgi:hypothetical protein